MKLGCHEGHNVRIHRCALPDTQLRLVACHLREQFALILSLSNALILWAVDCGTGSFMGHMHPSASCLWQEMPIACQWTTRNTLSPSMTRSAPVQHGFNGNDRMQIDGNLLVRTCQEVTCRRWQAMHPERPKVRGQMLPYPAKGKRSKGITSKAHLVKDDNGAGAQRS